MQHAARPVRDEAEVGRAVERVAGLLTVAGMARMPARVFSAIIMSPEGALTAAEIGERLSVSPGAVSKAMQYLTQVQLVHREYVPGSRRERYRVGDDLWSGLFEFRVQWLKRMADVAAESIEASGGEDSGAGARLAELRDFCVFGEKELVAMLEHWRAYRGRPPEG